jgi:hypothetical protein
MRDDSSSLSAERANAAIDSALPERRRSARR